jgi:hypothetical protein
VSLVRFPRFGRAKKRSLKGIRHCLEPVSPHLCFVLGYCLKQRYLFCDNINQFVMKEFGISKRSIGTYTAKRRHCMDGIT